MNASRILTVISVLMGTVCLGAGFTLIMDHKAASATTSAAVALCTKNDMIYHRINRVDVCVGRKGQIYFLEALS